MKTNDDVIKNLWKKLSDSITNIKADLLYEYHDETKGSRIILSENNLGKYCQVHNFFSTSVLL